MITKESHAIAIKGLRQEQSLRNRVDAGEVGYVVNPKSPDLIPRPLGPASAGPSVRRLRSFSPGSQRGECGGNAVLDEPVVDRLAAEQGAEVQRRDEGLDRAIDPLRAYVSVR